MVPKVIKSILFGFTGLSMILMTGCFSYHRNETQAPPAQVSPSEPPGTSTTTSATRSNNGSSEQSTTTYDR